MQRNLQVNPLNDLATWDEIKSRRDEIEQSPVTITEGTFDADEIAFKRMELALNSFTSLPTLVNGELTWKLADNSTVALTETELQAVYDALREAVAVRAATIHVSAATLYASGTTTVGDLQNLSNWGL